MYIWFGILLVVSLPLSSTISIQNCLSGGETSEVRHEYVASQLAVMSGASRARNFTSPNIHTRLCECYRLPRKILTGVRNEWPIGTWEVDVHEDSETAALIILPGSGITSGCPPIRELPVTITPSIR
ncbi:hypothetical protein Noc_2020 [Nitrosococcus oceani ATCC 19707]|uniref:Uncharacterized protein n=1 Tax=Nitrosococcus oceani (strain ATCC 19707 / BCRC 17464 / JCM 30415 / NCIMB 11848 / C-107) TaxID=323261 RepID=Q3J9L5_NITOC|nr:hypothetical protein [Nitrosococcus oceani]ABA58481.1 hypothetical protein Noc_2020 [Nitrosococcus oceani ATCC 19707]